MADNIFLFFIFLPFIFSLYLIFKRITLSSINKNVLNYGLSTCVIISLISSLLKQFFVPDEVSVFLLVSNIIFSALCITSVLYFKYKKQFMFTNLRYNIFLSLFITLTYIFALSNNLILSASVWIVSGILIYVFSYFDIFKTNADYNVNRFYSIFLIGDFCLLLSVFIFVKYAVISNNYSYGIEFSDIQLLSSYIYGNSDFEYLVLPACIILALFSRAFIFPFSCFFSFLLNASSLLYLVIFSTLAPLYSLTLFLKLGLFDTMGFYFKIYLMVMAIFMLFLLLFERHFKVIFGYILSIANSLFLVCYFYNDTLSLTGLIIIHLMLMISLSVLFIKDKLSLKKRVLNFRTGFIQERCFIYLTEKLPLQIADIVCFINNFIVKNVLAFFGKLINAITYYYVCFTQKKTIPATIRGIVIIFGFFAILAIFIALFGSFGEMQN